MNFKEIEEKEKLYCHLMRKAFVVALKDRETSNKLNYKARKLKNEIEYLRNQLHN